MIILTSLITIISLSPDLQNQPATVHIYDDHKFEYKTDAEIPSVVAWQELSRQLGFELPVIQGKVATTDHKLIQAFRKIELPEKEGLRLLLRAKEILSAANYPCTNVVPVIANDSEEGVSYLTLHLNVNASMEKAFELDTALTHGLISSFPRLPVRLSFAVYENEDEAV